MKNNDEILINLLKRELPIKLEQLFLGEIDEQDRSLTAMGAGLQIFSQYKNLECGCIIDVCT